MILEAQVGPGNAADGAKIPARLGKDGAVMVQSAHGALQEAAIRGALFHAMTAATGVAPGTAIGTAAAFALANPEGSGKLLVVHELLLGYISGTLGAGVVVACGGTKSFTAVTGTAIAPQGGKIGAAPGVGKAFTTATLPAAPAGIRPVFNLGAFVATEASVPGMLAAKIDGAIVVPPGCSLSLQGVAAAGTTPLVVLGAVWEEIAE